MRLSEVQLSIIIPTCNRGNNLIQVLDSITRLLIDKQLFELIVVDNASTDNTKIICNEFIERHSELNVIYLYEPVPGLMSGRHFGAENAKGHILSFLDDDCDLSPAWADSILQIMNQRPDVDLLTGPNLPKYESYPPSWLNYFWQKTPYGGQQCGELSLLDLGQQIVEIDAIWVWGLNFVIRKSAYEKLRGFHPDIVPQRIQFLQGDGETGISIKANEMGMKSLYHFDVLLYHIVPEFRLTSTYFEKRYYYQGIADSYTSLRYQHGLYINKYVEPSKMPLAKKLKRFVKKQYREIFKINENEVINDEITNLRNRFYQKYSEGYAYHQHHFNTNPNVRDWVLRPDYMDYKLPIL
jgi:glycosyltransferase involved in cell wall biosynthesis